MSECLFTMRFYEKNLSSATAQKFNCIMEGTVNFNAYHSTGVFLLPFHDSYFLGIAKFQYEFKRFLRL